MPMVTSAANAGFDGRRLPPGIACRRPHPGSLIPNAELRMIDDGHLFMVTRPAEVAAVMEEFLAKESK